MNEFNIGDTVQYIGNTYNTWYPAPYAIGKIIERNFSKDYYKVSIGDRSYWLHNSSLLSITDNKKENKSFTISIRKHKRINLKFAL